MKNNIVYFHLMFSILLFIHCTSQNVFPTLKGPYLGQKPPVIRLGIFAPGILNIATMGLSMNFYHRMEMIFTLFIIKKTMNPVVCTEGCQNHREI